MKKILLIPLDERPCNYLFPKLLGDMSEYQIVMPPASMMGDKKTPGDVEAIYDWTLEHVASVEGLIISFDTLLYGGIIPSRLHSDTLEALAARLKKIEAFKKVNPNLTIYGFNLIMRNPTYSSSDEEPDYYADFGREIHLRGVYEHKTMLNNITEAEKVDFQAVKARLPEAIYQDYCKRREINGEINKLVIEYVHKKVVNFLIIPQDDASPYGLTAMDQKRTRKTIDAFKVNRYVYMYPGADEVANTLLSRMLNVFNQRQPKVYIKYTSEMAKGIIPLFEDRPLHETVKYQVIAAGGVVCTSISEADLLLIVNAPPSNMLNASQSHLRGIEYEAFMNLNEAMVFAKYVHETLKKPIMIGDVAYGNGSDMALIGLLMEYDLLYAVASYAGWNTSSNTLGTTIPHGMIRSLYGMSQAHLNFLGHRYVEDAGYCANIRQKVISEVLPGLNLTYFKVDGQRGKANEEVLKHLKTFIQDELNDPFHEIIIKDCYLPWRRMFEVGLSVEVRRRETT